jgi:hypothetical protein
LIASQRNLLKPNCPRAVVLPEKISEITRFTTKSEKAEIAETALAMTA